MNLTFLGGADEVGASSTLIEIAGKRILVDAGIRISPRARRGIQNDQLPDLHPISEAGGPDYILVTHAHTDHTGALPLIVEQYPHVPVLATQPSIDLTRVLQSDAQQIMQTRQEAEGELPLFDEVAVGRLLEAFQVVEFRQPVRLGDGLQVTYFPSGHIIGAGALLFESEEGTLMMSGDLSLTEQRAVVKANIPRLKVDALVLESTYGGKLHANRIAEEKRLMATLERITLRGGKVLIPAFALGRAQEILQIILAHRDQLEVPVYVDGMVRSVCRVYTRFAGWLPEATVQAAKEENLFFRSRVIPVQNALQREDIARSECPAIIVASSGMLTGGASVAYAKHLIGDEANAILLTGYQDEESPGRFLQAMTRQRQAGEEATLRIENQTLTVRSDVDTYSLSAHADESELVSIAESLEPEEVLLVHGDPAARHSLATRLRQRGRRVHLPKISQVFNFGFATRPWAMAKVKSGSETRPIDTGELWKALRVNAGNYYSAQELAQIWWGDITRRDEVITALTHDNLYFAADWRQKDSFRVRTPEQVERTHKLRAIMLENPDIIGKLVVLRNSNGQARIGVVVNADVDSFEAVVHNAKGRHYPADALLWVIGVYDGPPENKGMEARLSKLAKEADALRDLILPFERRQWLIATAQPVNPTELLPDILPDGITEELALLAVVFALAQDGAKVTTGGLLPMHALPEGPMEQNQARELAIAAFPPEARLRKVGMESHRQRMTLTFDFPDRAAGQYAETIRQISDQTGWHVVVNPSVNQQALGTVLDELLPDGVRIVNNPSYYIDKHEVQTQIEGQTDLQSLIQDYLHITGFRLNIRNSHETSYSNITTETKAENPNKMEINAAYTHIKHSLKTLGLYKTSLKQGQIILSFISPQVGERHYNKLQQLSEETGYNIVINPNPNQQEILHIAQQLIRTAGWQIRKGPGIHTTTGEVTVTLTNEPDTESLTKVTSQFEDITGYRLVLS